MNTTTQHIPNLGWRYEADQQSFVLDVSYGHLAEPHGVGTAWAAELHIRPTENDWDLVHVAISAPGYLDVENLAGRIVAVRPIDSGENLLGLLDEGLAYARSLQHTIDENGKVA